MGIILAIALGIFALFFLLQMLDHFGCGPIILVIIATLILIYQWGEDNVHGFFIFLPAILLIGAGFTIKKY